MKTLLVGLGLAAAMAALSSPAHAQSNYPWCAYYGQGFSGTNCGFTTFEQCMATVHGIGGFCQKNDWYRPSAAAPQSRRRTPY